MKVKTAMPDSQDERLIFQWKVKVNFPLESKSFMGKVKVKCSLESESFMGEKENESEISTGK